MSDDLDELLSLASDILTKLAAPDCTVIPQIATVLGRLRDNLMEAGFARSEALDLLTTVASRARAERDK